MRKLQEQNVNENVKKIDFRAYLRQKWIDLGQTKIKVIIGSFYTYRLLHFISGNACDNL